MIKFNGSSYTEIIPVGEECYACGSIEANGLRKNAFPMDYVAGVMVGKILGQLKQFSLINDQFITRENIDIKFYPAIQKYYLFDKRYDFHYWHDVIADRPENITEEMINLFLETRNRRYQRFFAKLGSNEPIIFFSVHHFGRICSVSADTWFPELMELHHWLRSKNPKAITVAVNYKHENIIKPELGFYHYYIKGFSKIEEKALYEIELKKLVKSLFQKTDQ